MYDFIRLFNDFAIPYSGPNSRDRYELPCYFPDCGSSSDKYIASIHIKSGNAINCYKCGRRTLDDAIPYMTGGHQWKDIKLQYKTEYDIRDRFLLEKKQPEQYAESVILPKGKGLNPQAFQYLKNRGFDPYQLQEKYNIYSTGHFPLDYKFRIIIPIYYEYKLVSYQGRDYTGLVPKELRYKSCRKINEVIHYKHILYGIDKVPTKHVIVTEGPFDKWKLGDDAVSIFGLAYTPQQVILLSERFTKVTILFDPSKPGKEQPKIQAEKLGNELSGLGLDINIIYLKGDRDPGDLSYSEAEQLTKKIMRG